ncbi:hypothetical protein [Streptosporangium saharense]|uniref:hypothetical protein n=1 Tax=Streptosporangium saharense TaxID=1706840 RepID=UPI0036C76E96
MARRALLGALAGALAGAAAARLAYTAFSRRPPVGDTETWERTNHRGEQITLLEGPAFAAGAAAAATVLPGLPARTRAAVLLAVTGSGALGAYDDLYGATASKGFRGHLNALAKGEVTSGAVKLFGIGVTGLAAAALTAPRPVDVAIDGALVAGSANLANLFDLRPGRAIKVGLLAGLPLLAAGVRRDDPVAAILAALPAGAALALLPEDLGERAMLGDAGANALGALVGLAATAALGRPGRLAVLGTVVALTAASERISFTRVIAANPVLNRIDMLGRRPVEQAPAD